LSTEDWLRVLREAREMGAVQLGISGGEPLLRDDVEVMVAEAHRLGYYTNLLTSGVGLTEKRIAALKEGGLDQIQLSFQDSTRELNDFLSSTRTFELKSKVAKLIKQYEYPMVLNVVLHRLNIDHIRPSWTWPKRWVWSTWNSPTQYYAWALINRDQLLPSREQLVRAEAITNQFRARMGNKCKVYFVVPDYYATRPKACMNGWGRCSSTSQPTARSALPRGAHAAGAHVPERARSRCALDLGGVSRLQRLSRRRLDAGALPELPGKTKDFGGCRCQAYMLTGDATNTDPVCDLSPKHP
jgi:pyrroloquinoline quinone biosynthesis protein E